MKVAKPLLEGPIDDVRGLMRAVDAIEKLGQPVIIYPDAEEVIERRLHEERIKDLTDAIRRNPAEPCLEDTQGRISNAFGGSSVT